MRERPQQAHIRAVQALIAHEVTHPWKKAIPCRTCEELERDVDRAISACVSPR